MFLSYRPCILESSSVDVMMLTLQSGRTLEGAISHRSQSLCFFSISVESVEHPRADETTTRGGTRDEYRANCDLRSDRNRPSRAGTESALLRAEQLPLENYGLLHAEMPANIDSRTRPFRARARTRAISEFSRPTFLSCTRRTAVCVLIVTHSA